MIDGNFDLKAGLFTRRYYYDTLTVYSKHKIAFSDQNSCGEIFKRRVPRAISIE